MQKLAADLGERLRRRPRSWPWIVSGFVHVILKLVKRLNGQPGHAIVGGVAVGLEVVQDAGASPADVIVRQLAAKPSLIGRISQHPVCGLDVKAVRPDRR
jgi:hypothetical protein